MNLSIMNRQIIALVLQEGGKLVSEFLSMRSPKRHAEAQPQVTYIAATTEPEAQEKPPADTDTKIKEGVACLPCTNSHLHTCRGLLDEAVRMSHDGLTPEAMERVDKCLGEIAAAERIDLAPENINALPPDEGKIAHFAAKEIRDIRHGLEGVSSPAQLEQLAVKTTNLQKQVGSEWFKLRLSKMKTEN